MTRRRPFRRRTDGPVRKEGSDDSPSTADETPAAPQPVPPRRQQTAEHHFDDGAFDHGAPEDRDLAPPRFPASFSQAANVWVDPVALSKLQTASPDHPVPDPNSDDDPLIKVLRRTDGDGFEPLVDDEPVDQTLDVDSANSPDANSPDALNNLAQPDDYYPTQVPVLELGPSPEPSWRVAREGDVGEQVEFLQSEIRRYQADLERERVARTTAITAAQIAADNRVEELIRTHRHERDQLELVNRQLLDAQRSDAEARRSALIEEHRRQRASEHAQYQERITTLRSASQISSQAAADRFESDVSEAHQTQLAALQTKLDEATKRSERLTVENHELQTERQAREQQLAEAQATLSRVETRERDATSRLIRQVEELQDRLTRSEQRLNSERQRSSERVANLLRESAQVASRAQTTDQEIAALRSSWADERDAVVAATLADARAIERAAAEREAHLEATIGQLRAALRNPDSSTSVD